MGSWIYTGLLLVKYLEIKGHYGELEYTRSQCLEYYNEAQIFAERVQKSTIEKSSQWCLKMWRLTRFNQGQSITEAVSCRVFKLFHPQLELGLYLRPQ